MRTGRRAHPACDLGNALQSPQANFERQSDNGAFEEQYKRLVGEIETIYEGAKEFHQHGCARAAGPSVLAAERHPAGKPASCLAAAFSLPQPRIAKHPHLRFVDP